MLEGTQITFHVLQNKQTKHGKLAFPSCARGNESGTQGGVDYFVFHD